MLTKDDVEALERKWKRVLHLKAPHDAGAVPAWEVVIRPPTRAEYRALREENNNPRTRAEAQENLISGCVVYPEPDAFQALLEDYPALCDGICTLPAVQDMMGFALKTAAKR